MLKYLSSVILIFFNILVGVLFGPETGKIHPGTGLISTISLFLNWDSLHARLNSHCEVWGTRKKSTKRLERTGNLFRKNLKLKDVC